MDTGNKYQVNDYNKTNNISTVDIMNENNNNNNMLENNNNDNNIFKQLAEEENEARKIEHELDTVSKSEILKAMPASFRFAAKLVFLFENDKHPIKFILKWISIIASIFITTSLYFSRYSFIKFKSKLNSKHLQFAFVFMGQCPL